MTGVPPIKLAPHDSPLGRWESIARRPHTAAVDLSFGYQGFRGEMRLRRELHLPSGFPAIVVNFGAPFLVTDAGGTDPVVVGDISYMGVRSTPFVTDTSVERDLLVINLTPIGARRLLGAPMSELTNKWFSLADIVGRRARELNERLHDATDWRTRFSVLDAFLLTRSAEAPTPRRDLSPAWRWMSAGGGAAALARRHDVSHKHLIDQFRDQIGLPPKLVGRLARFNRVLRLRGPADWAEAAHTCGYFDQAHMINEFRDFAGATPGALAERRAAFTLRA